MNKFRERRRHVVSTCVRLLWPTSRRRLALARLDQMNIVVAANEDIGRQLLLFRDFEPDESQFFMSIIRDGDVCLDVGANIGYFTILFAKLTPAGSVHAFEPIPSNVLLVSTNVCLNACSNVCVTQAAVGESEGLIQFSVSSDSAYSSIHATGRSAERETIDVTMTSIDAYVAKHTLEKVDVLKVDVEGAEKLVVTGAAILLSDVLRRPRIVLLELFAGNLVPFNTTVNEIVDRMLGFGYVAKTLKKGALSSWDETMRDPNVFFVLPDSL